MGTRGKAKADQVTGNIYEQIDLGLTKIATAAANQVGGIRIVYLSSVGADAAASWWHRNFRMYANIQKAAALGDRVLVVAGQGHTAILKELLAADDQRRARDVREYLSEK